MCGMMGAAHVRASILTAATLLDYYFIRPVPVEVEADIQVIKLR